MRRVNKWLSMMGMWSFLIVVAVAQQPPVPPMAEVETPAPAPGRLKTFEFPDLPKTLAGAVPSMTVRWPSGYDPNKKYPIALWLNGGQGGKGGPATHLVDADKYICIGLPLFKKPARGKASGVEAVHVDYKDADTIWDAYSVMLKKLETEAPNIEFGKGVAAGFSNGAHTIGVLLSEKTQEIRRYFGAFIFVEGGYMLKKTSAVKGCPILVLAGEKSWAHEQLGFSSSPSLNARSFARKFDGDLIVMEGVGHDFPSAQYAPKIREWLKQKGF